MILAFAVALLTVGCYNDFDTPAPEKLYTDGDMTALGLEQLSIADLKAQFEKAFGSISGTGTNSSFSTTCTLKLGALDLDEEGFEGLRGWEDASKYYIKGKVISSDRQGNIYKSLFI